MNSRKRFLLALTVIGLLLAAALPALAQETGAADPRPAVNKIRGKVTAIEGTTLTLHNAEITVRIHTGERTRYRVPGVEKPTLADVHVGDTVHVAAVRRAGGKLFAALIAVADTYRLRGQVTAINGLAITIKRPGNSLVAVTDDHTRFRVPGVKNATLADVHVGDLVGLVAFGQPDGSILARGVAVLKGIRVRGQVTARNGAVLTLSTAKGPLDLLTHAETRYRVPGLENPTLDDVHVGDHVVVATVSAGPGGGLLAKGIAVRPAQEEQAL